jgi:hypothetical protein
LDRRQRSWASVVFLLLAGAGCAADTDDRVLDITYDPCDARVLTDDDATDAELQNLGAAFELWNRSGGGFRLQRIDQGGAREPPPLVVHFRSSLGPFHGYYDDEVGEISIHRGLRDRAEAVTIAHELGHAFGLWHVKPSTRASVMNPGNTTVAPTERDVDSVRALWGTCDPAQNSAPTRAVTPMVSRLVPLIRLSENAKRYVKRASTSTRWPK